MARAAGPERRTMPMPPRPGGVEMATMVSSNSDLGKSVTGFLIVPGEKFVGVVEGVFAGVFAKSGVQNVVFWWLDRGGLLVKRGEKTPSFWRAKMCHVLQLYFSKQSIKPGQANDRAAHAEIGAGKAKKGWCARNHGWDNDEIYPLLRKVMHIAWREGRYLAAFVDVQVVIKVHWVHTLLDSPGHLPKIYLFKEYADEDLAASSTSCGWEFHASRRLRRTYYGHQ
jgi:hypothetical protein